MRCIEITQFDMTRKAAKDYEKHIGQFVVINKYDGSKVVGIFEYITPDFKLFIKGKHGERRVDPLEIKEFYSRPDKFSSNRGDGNQV